MDDFEKDVEEEGAAHFGKDNSLYSVCHATWVRVGEDHLN